MTSWAECLSAFCSVGFSHIQSGSIGFSLIESVSIGFSRIQSGSIGFSLVHSYSVTFSLVQLDSVGFSLVQSDSVWFIRIQFNVLLLRFHSFNPKARVRVPKPIFNKCPSLYHDFFKSQIIIVFHFFQYEFISNGFCSFQMARIKTMGSSQIEIVVAFFVH